MNRALLRPGVLAVFSLLYALSVVAGRATRLSGGEVALVWPAAAVAVIWILSVQRYDHWARAIHIAMLGLSAFVTTMATGAAALFSAWFALDAVILAVVTVKILTYRGKEVVLRDPVDLGRLLVAVLCGCGCAAVWAAAFLVTTTGAPTWQTFALFLVRNGTSALIAVPLWLRVRDITWKRPQISLAAFVETSLVAVGVSAVFVWIFWFNSGLPLAFLVMVPAMWLALRYSTTVSTLFVNVAGTWIIFATLANRGVFIVPDIQTRALLAQAMVFSVAVVVLALALYRDSRARLIEQLQEARDEADRNSELVGAVLDSIHDSVILVDSAGEVVLTNARAAESDLVGHVASVSRAANSSDAPRPGNVSRDVTFAADDPRVIELATVPLSRQTQFTVAAFRDVTEERTHSRELREARDLFAGVLQAASEQAIVGTDSSGRISVFNNGAQRLLGWTQAEMLGRSPMDFLYRPEVRARAHELGVPVGLEVFVHNVTADSAEVREWTYVRRDGTKVSVSLAVSQMTDPEGNCTGYIGVATNITDRKTAEQALADSEERFRLAFDTAPTGMFMFDVATGSAGRITRCNQAMSQLIGRPIAEVLDMTVTELGNGHTDCSANSMQQLLELGLGQLFEAEVAFRRSDDHTVWGAVTASVVAPRGPHRYGICLVEDITSRKHSDAELRHQASHDPLTGLANRALMLNRIEHALAETDDMSRAGVGVLFLDLDGFKAVNDIWGHAQGDRVLETVARRIESSIRQGDTAARLGGDEFAILCSAVSDYGHLRSLAERIRAELQQPFVLDTGEIYHHLSVSTGAVLSQPGSTAETLLRWADQCMYQAKRKGKDCIVDRAFYELGRV